MKLPGESSRSDKRQERIPKPFEVLLASDGTAVACGTNDEGQCDIPDGQYTPSLREVHVLQAVIDGGSMRFLTFGGVERFAARAAPDTPLADVYSQLLAAHCACRLFGGPAGRVDAALPGGRLLSNAASAKETVASATSAT